MRKRRGRASITCLLVISVHRVQDQRLFFSQNGKHFTAFQRFRTFADGAAIFTLYLQGSWPLHQFKSLYPSN